MRENDSEGAIAWEKAKGKKKSLERAENWTETSKVVWHSCTLVRRSIRSREKQENKKKKVSQVAYVTRLIEPVMRVNYAFVTSQPICVQV